MGCSEHGNPPFIFNNYEETCDFEMHFLPLSLRIPTNLLLAKEVKKEAERRLKRNMHITTCFPHFTSFFEAHLWNFHCC